MFAFLLYSRLEPVQRFKPQGLAGYLERLLTVRGKAFVDSNSKQNRGGRWKTSIWPLRSHRIQKFKHTVEQVTHWLNPEVQGSNLNQPQVLSRPLTAVVRACRTYIRVPRASNSESNDSHRPESRLRMTTPSDAFTLTFTTN